MSAEWEFFPFRAPRKAVWLLLTGAGLLGGCSTLAGYKPTLPDSCVWTKIPHAWICIDPEEGRVYPKEESELWESYPLSMLEFQFDKPLQPFDVLDLREENGSIDWVKVVESNINPHFALRKWAICSFGER